MSKSRKPQKRKGGIRRFIPVIVIVLLLASFGGGNKGSTKTNDARSASVAAVTRGTETSEEGVPAETTDGLAAETEAEDPTELAAGATVEAGAEEPLELAVGSAEAETAVEDLTRAMPEIPEPEPVAFSLEVLEGKKTLSCSVGKTADPLKLVQAFADPAGDVKVSADVGAIDLSKPHTEKVTYEVAAVNEAGVESSEQFTVDFIPGAAVWGR